MRIMAYLLRIGPACIREHRDQISECLLAVLAHSSAKVRTAHSRTRRCFHWVLIPLLAQVRWNACIAAAALFGGLDPTGSTEAVRDAGDESLHSLIDLLQLQLAQDTSFKVRLHAANALSTLPQGLVPEDLAAASQAAHEAVVDQLANGAVGLREKPHAEALCKRVSRTGPVVGPGGLKLTFRF